MSIPRSLKAVALTKNAEIKALAEATPDMFSPETIAGMIQIGEWMTKRAQAIRDLLGGKEPGAPIRDTICREACLCLARNERHRIHYYQSLCSQVSSSFATREEIFRLATIGILVVRREPNNSRRTLVVPSARLALWYTDVTPRLLAEACQIFCTKIRVEI